MGRPLLVPLAKSTTYWDPGKMEHILFDQICQGKELNNLRVLLIFNGYEFRLKSFVQSGMLVWH